MFRMDRRDRLKREQSISHRIIPGGNTEAQIIHSFMRRAFSTHHTELIRNLCRVLIELIFLSDFPFARFQMDENGNSTV